MNDDFRLLGEMYTVLVESIESIKKYLANRTNNADTINFFTQRDNNNAPLFNDGEVMAYYKWLEAKQANTNIILAYHKKYRSLQPPRKDIRQFKDFQSFELYVDGIIGRAHFKQKKEELHQQATQAPDSQDVIEDNDEVLIIHGSNQDKCIRYGKGYTFCISSPQPDQNMYSHYRMGERQQEGGVGADPSQTSFYFIFFKKTPKSDPKHICVLNITRGKSHMEWSFADNKTVSTSWEEVLKTFPILAKYKSKLKFVPISKEEKKESSLSRITLGHSDNSHLRKFMSLDFADKIKVINGFGRRSSVTDEAFNYIAKDKILLHTLANTGVQKLTYQQYLAMPPQEQKWYAVKAERLFNKIAQQDGWNVTADAVDSLLTRTKAKSAVSMLHLGNGNHIQFSSQHVIKLPDGTKESPEFLILPDIIAARYLQDPSTNIHRAVKERLQTQFSGNYAETNKSVQEFKRFLEEVIA